MPLPIRGITVSVGYDDLLAITLPRNASQLEEVVVVTDFQDTRTLAVCAQVPNVRVHQTDAFYRDGAAFNKGAALEEGFDVLGRTGWIIIWDADTLFPADMQPKLRPDCLANPQRRILQDPSQWHPDLDWNTCPLAIETSFPGYFQLFNAADPVLRERPWYGTDSPHCGACDTVFHDRWPASDRVRMKLQVLHLGPRCTNWLSRLSKRADDLPVSQQQREPMQALRQRLAWPERKKIEFLE